MLAALLTSLFDTEGFPPRWKCGTGWSPLLGWTHIISDLLIFVSYSAIPVSIAIFALRRRDIRFPIIAWLFFAFILLCGLTHLIEAIIFWEPVYRLAAVVKAMTAAVSLATAFALFRLGDQLYKVPDPFKEVESARLAIAECEAERRSLAEERTRLEQRTSQLTTRDYRMRHAMASAEVAAVRWNGDTLEIDWQIGMPEVLGIYGVHRTDVRSWTEILDERGAAELRQAQLAAERTNTGDGFMVELALARPGVDRGVRIVMRARREEPVKGDVPTFVGMCRFEITPPA